MFGNVIGGTCKEAFSEWLFINQPEGFLKVFKATMTRVRFIFSEY